MRHAYLIIAHNEFDILRLLISLLDDERNDIYVHIDKKVKSLPVLKTTKSALYVLKDRMDVRWGNYSQIKCEFLLWEAAMANGPYNFYHLISGTHLPLKNQNEIHSFFDNYQDECLFCNLEKRNRDYQEILKLHRVNLFTRTYASPNKTLLIVCQFLWKSFIAIQRWLKITINDGIQFYWANNWCSLSHDGVSYLMEHKQSILRRYRWSFCGDEWFAPTELLASYLNNKVLNENRLLFGSIGRYRSEFITIDNIHDALSSDCLFARKFRTVDMLVAKEILQSYDKTDNKEMYS